MLVSGRYAATFLFTQLAAVEFDCPIPSNWLLDTVTTTSIPVSSKLSALLDLNQRAAHGSLAVP